MDLSKTPSMSENKLSYYVYKYCKEKGAFRNNDENRQNAAH